MYPPSLHHRPERNEEDYTLESHFPCQGNPQGYCRVPQALHHFDHSTLWGHSWARFDPHAEGHLAAPVQLRIQSAFCALR